MFQSHLNMARTVWGKNIGQDESNSGIKTRRLLAFGSDNFRCPLCIKFMVCFLTFAWPKRNYPWAGGTNAYTHRINMYRHCPAQIFWCPHWWLQQSWTMNHQYNADLYPNLLRCVGRRCFSLLFSFLFARVWLKLNICFVVNDAALWRHLQLFLMLLLFLCFYITHIRTDVCELYAILLGRNTWLRCEDPSWSKLTANSQYVSEYTPRGTGKHKIL